MTDQTANPSAAAHSSGAGDRSSTESPSVKRVREAQRMLGVTETGKMGKPTRDALERYQLAAGLPVSGDLTAQTWKALHR